MCAVVVLPHIFQWGNKPSLHLDPPTPVSLSKQGGTSLLATRYSAMMSFY